MVFSSSPQYNICDCSTVLGMEETYPELTEEWTPMYKNDGSKWRCIGAWSPHTECQDFGIFYQTWTGDNSESSSISLGVQRDLSTGPPLSQERRLERKQSIWQQSVPAVLCNSCLACWQGPTCTDPLHSSSQAAQITAAELKLFSVLCIHKKLPTEAHESKQSLWAALLSQ